MSAARHRLLAATLLAAALAAAPARANTSLGADWTTGFRTRGYDVHGGLDLDAKKTWEADLLYSTLHAAAGTESRSHQFTASLYHDLDAAWGANAKFTGWRDTINDVQYLGPSFGFSYTAREASSSPDSPGDEDWKLSFDSELYVYKADQTTSKTIRVKFKPVTITNQGSVSLAQLHPLVSFERPLFSGAAVPWASLGHYFYSKGPAAIESRAGQPHFSAAAGSIGGLTGGLLANSGQTGFSLYLPWTLRLDLSLGASQSATDYTWATTQGASLGAVLLDRVELLASVSRTIQSGQHQDLTTAGATWRF